MARLVSARAWLVLFILLLVASSANLVAGVLLYFPPTGTIRLPPGVKKPPLIGPAAAALGWPGPTPHARPWPKPSTWDRESRFGRTFLNVAAQGATPDELFQMQASRMGWPFPVIQHVQRWWPWEHPNWKLPDNRQDLGISLVWQGLVLNPLIVAGVPWLLVIGGLAGWRWMVGRRRLAAGTCAACGYPIGVSERCTECGVPIPGRLRGAGAS